MDFLLYLAIVPTLGFAAQWIAWRTSLPSILLLLIFGLVLGQFVQPDPFLADLVGGDAAATPVSEIRRVTLVALGALTFHGFRVEHRARLRAEFHYPATATATTTPARIVVETRSPLIVPLAAHDIKPRDASGTFLAEGTKLLGTKVGRDARVSLQLVATPGH